MQWRGAIFILRVDSCATIEQHASRTHVILQACIVKRGPSLFVSEIRIGAQLEEHLDGCGPAAQRRLVK